MDEAMHASHLDIVLASDFERWHGVLNESDGFDFYHLPEYHVIESKSGEAQGMLFIYREASRMAAWPFLVRSLTPIGGLEVLGAEYRDAISVYGYSGPVCNHYARQDLDFLRRFGEALQSVACDLKLVCLFSRLHPVLENARLVDKIGKITHLSETVSINLSLDPDEQWLNYRKSHRYEISRARQEGVWAYRDEQWESFDAFHRLYTATMQRRNAASRYFFDKAYLNSLRRMLGDRRVQLFVAEKDGALCAASLFIHTGAIIQYHLAGSDPAFAKFAPSKLVIDEARLWGNTVGARYLHLGGGVGSSNDSLFAFKSGFSPLRHQFSVWTSVELPHVYELALEARDAWLKEKGLKTTVNSYFPAYRTPVKQIESGGAREVVT